MSLSFNWHARREGNSGYVLEERPDGTSVEYGPMPSQTVPHFITARRKYINFMMKESGFMLTLNGGEEQPDYSYLSEGTVQ